MATEISGVLISEQSRNNFPLYNLYLIAEVGLISAIYYQVSGRKYRKEALAGFLIFCLAWLLEFFFSKSISGHFFNYAYCLGSLAILLYCIRHLFEFFSDQNLDRQTAFQAFFRVSTGFLFYYTGGFVLFAFFTYLAEHNVGLLRDLYWINKILMFLMYILILVGIWLDFKGKTSGEQK